MLQFYFLSILVNLLIGAILVFSPPAQNTEEENTHSLTHLIFDFSLSEISLLRSKCLSISESVNT